MPPVEVDYLLYEKICLSCYLDYFKDYLSRWIWLKLINVLFMFFWSGDNNTNINNINMSMFWLYFQTPNIDYSLVFLLRCDQHALQCICKDCECDWISARAIIEAERQLGMLAQEDALEDESEEPAESTEDAQ